MDTIRNNSSRSKNALIGFMIMGIVLLFSSITTLYQNSVIKNHPEDLEKLELTDYLSMVSGITQLVIFIVCIVLFLMWFRRAYGNLIRLNYNSLEYSETGSVWGYFIPFVNWIRPISTAKEIFINTQRAVKRHNDNYNMQQDTSFIIFWWVSYLINGVFSRYVTKKYDKAFDLESIAEANNLMIISDILTFIPLALVIYFIVKISKLETLLLETYSSRSIIDEIGIKED